MGLLRRIIRRATRPVRVKAHGIQGEQRVSAKLNRSGVYHKTINKLIILDDNGKSHQIDHIEIRENGIFCIETKNFLGWVFGNEESEKWTQTLSNGEKHSFFNPVKQNKSHCYHLRKILGNEYIVNSIVVMANNNAERINCDYVINLKDLNNYLNNFDNGVELSIEEIDYVYDTLLNFDSGMTNKEHIDNIKTTQKEISYGICPRCGGKLVLREGSYGTFYGCSNYPKCHFTKDK